MASDAIMQSMEQHHDGAERAGRTPRVTVHRVQGAQRHGAHRAAHAQDDPDDRPASRVPAAGIVAGAAAQRHHRRGHDRSQGPVHRAVPGRRGTAARHHRLLRHPAVHARESRTGGTPDQPHRLARHRRADPDRIEHRRALVPERAGHAGAAGGIRLCAVTRQGRLLGRARQRAGRARRDRATGRMRTHEHRPDRCRGALDGQHRPHQRGAARAENTRSDAGHANPVRQLGAGLGHHRHRTAARCGQPHRRHLLRQRPGVPRRHRTAAHARTARARGRRRRRARQPQRGLRHASDHRDLHQRPAGHRRARRATAGRHAARHQAFDHPPTLRAASRQREDQPPQPYTRQTARTASPDRRG